MFDVGSFHARTCSGVSRRSFLRLGSSLPLALGLGSSVEPALAAATARAKSVVFVFLWGAPSHLDTCDPKPDAPADYRGAMQTIDTRLTGVHFSELMAEQARIADKLVIIRSVHHNSSSHDPSSHLTQTGFYKTGAKGGPNQSPCIGSVVDKLRGSNVRGIPGYVAVPSIMRNGAAAYIGRSYNLSLIHI